MENFVKTWLRESKQMAITYSKCKQNVNNEFFYKSLLIYIKKCDKMTKLDALTAEVAARVQKCCLMQGILPEYVRINRAKRRTEFPRHRSCPDSSLRVG